MKMTIRMLQQYVAYVISSFELYGEEMTHNADYTQGQENSSRLIEVAFTLRALENELHSIESALSVLADKEEGIVWKA